MVHLHASVIGAQTDSGHAVGVPTPKLNPVYEREGQPSSTDRSSRLPMGSTERTGVIDRATTKGPTRKSAVCSKCHPSCFPRKHPLGPTPKAHCPSMQSNGLNGKDLADQSSPVDKEAPPGSRYGSRPATRVDDLTQSYSGCDALPFSHKKCPAKISQIRSQHGDTEKIRADAMLHQTRTI